MLAQHVGVVGIESAEVIEPERNAVDVPAVIPVRHVALREVPVRHVQARVAEDRRSEHARREVSPALVHEPRVLDVDHAFPAQPPAPPVEELAGVGGDSNEAKIEDASVEDRGLVRLPAVGVEGINQMRRQRDRGLARPVEDVVKRGEDEHVGIEVQHLPVEPFEKRSQEPRLDGRRELERRIHHRHAMELGALDADLVWARDREGLLVVPLPIVVHLIE